MRHTQKKGDTAVAQAIASFTKAGYDVSLPLTESAAYDLIVDTGRDLKRVQVRYTSSHQVDLRRIHSNSQGYVVKRPCRMRTIGCTCLIREARSFSWRSVCPPAEHGTPTGGSSQDQE